MDKKEYIIHFIYWLIRILLIFIIIFVLFKYALVMVIAAAIAVLLKPIVDRICKYDLVENRLIYSLVSIITVLLFYIIIIVFFVVFVVVLINIMKDMPLVIDHVYHQINMNDQWLSIITYVYTHAKEIIESITSSIIYQMLNIIFDLTKIVVKTGFTMLFSIIFLLEYRYVKIGLSSLSIYHEINRLVNIGKQVIYTMVKTYVILFVLTFIIFICGLPFVIKNKIWMTAFFICQFDFLPVLGIDMILIPWIIVNLVMHQFKKGIILTFMYILVIFVKNMLEPKLLGDVAGIRPGFMFMIMFLMMNILGMKGLILLPLMIIVICMLKIKWKENVK